MTEHNETCDEKVKPTAVGCVVTLLSVAVMLGVAYPVVHWLHSLPIQPPREAVIPAPLLIGAIFYGIVSGFLKLLGVRLWAKGEKELPPSAKG
jgi:hypothetical protein